MTTFNRFLFVLILALMLSIPCQLALAQDDSTPAPENTPVDDPAPDNIQGSDITFEESTGDIGITDSEITLPFGNESVTPAEDALGWILALGGVWIMWSLSVRMGFQKTVKPILTWLLATFSSFGTEISYTARTFLIVVGVIVAAYLTAQGLNMFDGAPSFIREGLSLEMEQVFTTIFLAMGAFLFHDVISWWTGDEV